jgi:hypothetical protein
MAPPFFSLAPDGGEWSASLPGGYTPGERAPDTHCVGGSVDPRASLDAVESRTISSPCRESNPGCPARSPQLYRLGYPGSAKIYQILIVTVKIIYCVRYVSV